MQFEFKENYKFDDLVKIVSCLRSPGGCPWDIEQNHKSIRKNFIEETYEVCEAIDNEDAEHLREELGDVLLQVVFHTQMEDEKGSFNIDDVSDEICKKLIIRHPHVFGNTNVENTDQVLDNWDKIKMQTHSQTTCGEVLDSVCKALPALMRGEKLYHKAKKAGFCTEGVEDIVDSAINKLSEIKSGNDYTQKTIGELLFDVVKLGERIRTDPEQALSLACDDFIDEIKEQERKSNNS